MTDVPPPGSPSQVPPTCRLLEGSGICADYRKKIDELFLKEREAAAKSDLVSKASSVVVRAALAVAVTAVAGLGSLSGYLWYRFVKLDGAMTGAAKYSVVPVGTVLAWTGVIPPWPKDHEGRDREPEVGDWHFYWRECDGKEIPLERHEDLNAVIGAIYGKADPGKVKMPDFRCYFLRGHGDGSEGLGKEQKANVSPADIRWTVRHSKSDLNGKPLYPRVSHVPRAAADSRLEPFVDAVLDANTNVAFDSDTRPKNFSVHWIIRVR